MWKIIVSIVCLVTATPGNASIEDILGEWFPIAVYPDIRTGSQECLKVTLTSNPGNLQCTDDKKFELVDLQSSDDPKVYTGGILMVEDVSIGAPSMTVTCTHEGKNIAYLMVAKLVNRDYALLYNPGYNDTMKQHVYIYGRNVPTRAELTNVVNDITGLRGKPLRFACTKD